MYYKEGDKFKFNGSLLESYDDIDLLIIEIPDEIREEFDPDNTMLLNLTIFLSSRDVQYLKESIAEAKDQIFTTNFRQVTYLNCEKLSFYLP